MPGVVPWQGRGLEVGVGSGRFAALPGVQVGVDPPPAMLALARSRGVETVEGAGEQLPFPDASFDHALVVTTVCFVDSPARMLAEARRMLKPGARLVIGFIDRDSPLGQDYLAHQAENMFYPQATFYSADEVERLRREAGFVVGTWVQTLAQLLAETREIELLRADHGECAFVVVAATRTR